MIARRVQSFWGVRSVTAEFFFLFFRLKKRVERIKQLVPCQ